MSDFKKIGNIYIVDTEEEKKKLSNEFLEKKMKEAIEEQEKNKVICSMCGDRGPRAWFWNNKQDGWTKHPFTCQEKCGETYSCPNCEIYECLVCGNQCEYT